MFSVHFLADSSYEKAWKMYLFLSLITMNYPLTHKLQAPVSTDHSAGFLQSKY